MTNLSTRLTGLSADRKAVSRTDEGKTPKDPATSETPAAGSNAETPPLPRPASSSRTAPAPAPLPVPAIPQAAIVAVPPVPPPAAVQPADKPADKPATPAAKPPVLAAVPTPAPGLAPPLPAASPPPPPSSAAPQLVRPVPPLGKPAPLSGGAPPTAAPPGAAVRAPAPMSAWRPRHTYLALSFAVMVLLPAVLTAFYLWVLAADEYASTVGFSVRREENGSAMELLGGITGLSDSSSSDTDILYEFLKSQKLVSDLEAKLGLRKMWSKPTSDPIFALDPDSSIEDLVDYWSKMVRISYDSSSRLIEVRALAFTAEDATTVAQALFDESSHMINDLSAIAREDSIRYAKEELDTAIERLKEARLAMTGFRLKHQLVDPKTDIQSQAGLIGALQAQLTEAQIELDLLIDQSSEGDPRILQARRRIEVIEARIVAEREKVGRGAAGQLDTSYAEIVSEYERLSVDNEFAERSYLAALASYDGSIAEAKRKSRYLAAHIMPTVAELPRFPRRWMILSVISLFLFLTWSISVLVTYSLRDRR